MLLRMRTMRFTRQLMALSWFIWVVGVADAELDYPGKPPGPADIHMPGPTVTLSNAAIRAVWKLTEPGLQLQSLYDVQSRHQLAFTGEVFQVVLSNGLRYPASRFAPDGAPRVTRLPAQASASRAADQIPGRQVELRLRSGDGLLHVAWRAVIHDHANYLRQEITLETDRPDTTVAEVMWIEESIPGARTLGQVDGSPLVAGSFFLGAEDPHALNRVRSHRQEIGTWSPADLTAGKTRNRTWLLEIPNLIQGTNEFQFQYERGPHRLDIWGVKLLENGQGIAQDVHHGQTGTADVDNLYSLAVRSLKPSAHYELMAELGTDPDFNLPEGQAVESYGRIFHLHSDGQISCRVPWHAPLRSGEKLTQSMVLGVAPAGQLRRAFLCYLERERAHPYRPFLHYNSWYDIAWKPFALNETNCLEAIRAFGDKLIKPHRVIMDAMVFDDGWDNPQSLWQFHSGFPNGFTPLAELCRHYSTRLGVWLSPFGGYGEPKQQRLKFGRQQGYEVNATGFSLAGPKYYTAFKQACVDMIRRYGVNHFKFDGIAAGTYASGSANYFRDTEAMRRLMLELRQEDPNLFINLTTGSWPSPFWLRYADSVWRQGGDMGLAGNGPRQQQWLTYRDQEVYRNIVRKGPLFPLNSLMTQGVAYSRQGSAGDPTFNSAGFKDDVRAFFGAGTGLQELYIQPGRLTEVDWQVLAEAARWSRALADVLVDTHWIGGDPSKGEVYGYASWSPRQGVVMLRNPDDSEHSYFLDVGRAFELPAGAVTQFTLKSPWKEDVTQRALKAEAGIPIRLSLKAFEVRVLEASPHN